MVRKAIITFIVFAAVIASGAASGEDIFAYFEDGFEGIVYVKDYIGSGSDGLKWRLLEFDLGERAAREVGEFSTVLPCPNDTLVGEEGNILYVFGMIPLDNENWGRAFIVMKRNSSTGQFETRKVKTVNVDDFEYLSLLDEFLDDRLYVNYLRIFEGFPDKRNEELYNNDRMEFWESCSCIEYECYPGEIELNRETIKISLGNKPVECIEAASRSYRYFLIEQDGISYIARKSRSSGSIENLVKFPSDCKSLEFVILDGEEEAVVSADLRGDFHPTVFLCDFADGETSLGESRVLYENTSFWLTSVQSPSLPGVVIMNRRKPEGDGPAFVEISALNVRDGSLYKIFEYIPRIPGGWTVPSNILQWVPSDTGTRPKETRVNNAVISHWPSNEGRPGLVP